jgi:hypothetical protein
MAKEFYTERDIEDMVKRGTVSLEVTDDVILTELAFEKAQRLGMQLLHAQPLQPPAAPVRPYLSQAMTPVSQREIPPAVPEPPIAEKIRSAVTAKLGTQIDPTLLDAIIQRVLTSTGLK